MYSRRLRMRVHYGERRRIGNNNAEWPQLHQETSQVKTKDLSFVSTTAINGSHLACRSHLTSTVTHTTWWKGNKGERRLNVAESHTASSLTRWWPRIVIEVNGLWAWHGSMWRKHMVPCTKRGSPKWWTYSDYPVGYAMELHEQLTPTKVYSAYKTRTSTLNDVTCRLCGKSSEILTHVLAGCSGLAQTKYLERHNAALKMLFFEMLKQHKLVDIVPCSFLFVCLQI